MDKNQAPYGMNELTKTALEIQDESVKKVTASIARAKDAAENAASWIGTLNATLWSNRIWARLSGQRGSSEWLNGRVGVVRECMNHNGKLLFRVQILRTDRTGFLWDDRNETRRFRSMAELELTRMPRVNHAERIVVPDDHEWIELRGKELPTAGV